MIHGPDPISTESVAGTGVCEWQIVRLRLCLECSLPPMNDRQWYVSSGEGRSLPHLPHFLPKRPLVFHKVLPSTHDCPWSTLCDSSHTS